jgi:RND family efflux transporter MFP subunit
MVPTLHVDFLTKKVILNCLNIQLNENEKKYMKKEKFIRTSIKILKPLIVIFIALGLLYWFKFRPVDVVSYTVVRGPVTDTVMGTGVLDAKNKMIISSKINGRIQKNLVDQGDVVKKGELVVTLDDDELAMQVKVAEANMETAKANIKKLQDDFNYAKAVLENAQKAFKRQKKLISGNIVSQAEFDKTEESLKIAQANFNRSKSAIAEAENKLLETQKNVDLRNAQLSYTRITAPFDGTITYRTRDPGDVVVPGSPILTLVSTKILWIKSWVGETELEKIKVGEPASIIFRSLPSEKFPGSVARIAKEVDKETREFIVDVNVDKLPLNWAIGQRAEVYIDTAKKNSAVTIPEEFLKWRHNLPGVFKLQGGRAVWTAVKTGLRGSGVIEITEGVNEQDTVLRPISPEKPIIDNCKVSAK